MANPSTHREALIAELLGDIDTLLARLETLQASLPAAVDTAVGRVRGAGETAAGGLSLAGDRLLAGFDRHAAQTLQGVQTAAREAQAAARLVDHAARRFLVLATVLGLCAGVLGGILVALALNRSLFGG